MSTPSLHDAVQALAGETIHLRRDLHRYPETAFEEHRTSDLVATRLAALGLQVRRNLGKTGVVGLLDSGRPGRTVLVRADMDALPIQEERDTPYRSTINGKMHACGHDGHTAILLTTAKIFAQSPESLSGKILFLFQPAEEVGNGAAAMLSDGALAGITVDAVLGLHLTTELPVGTVAARPGAALAATDMFTIQVVGRGGHAARPQETVDPLLMAAHIITMVQSLVAREVDPVDTAVLSITSIHGGTTFNIIPEQVTMQGTLRTFQPATRTMLQERLGTIVRGTAQTLRGEAALTWQEGTPAVVNDPEMTERFLRVAREVVGPQRVLTPPPITAGDDMALWLQQAPGCYFFVGARNEAKGIDKPHHHPQFDIDEQALPLGVELLCQGIHDFLRS
ncbi:MAG: amidohydrolase [Nitrospinota bacterium]|nr:MAG: amidohydrolase [Nitrospinota bacterium]